MKNTKEIQTILLTEKKEIPRQKDRKESQKY